MGEDTSAQLHSALTQLTRASTPGGGVLELQSPNLNLTTESRLLAELAHTPVRCETASSAAAEVALPPTILGAVAGLNATEPVAVLLYTSRQPLNPIDSGGGTGGIRNVTPSSPLVSFSLVQGGHALHVVNAEQPINVSVPLRSPLLASVSSSARPPCIGMPANVSAAECTVALECRWFDTANGNWSSAGCTTVLGGGGEAAHGAESLICSCSHLTDFVVFEVPTSSEELLADVSSALAINGFSQAALECIASPRVEKIPGVWAIDLALLGTAIFFLGRASRRDEEQIRLVELLVKGRRLERRQRFRNVAAAVLSRRQAGCAGPDAADHADSSALAAAFTSTRGAAIQVPSQAAGATPAAGSMPASACSAMTPPEEEAGSMLRHVTELAIAPTAAVAAEHGSKAFRVSAILSGSVSTRRLPRPTTAPALQGPAGETLSRHPPRPTSAAPLDAYSSVAAAMRGRSRGGSSRIMPAPLTPTTRQQQEPPLAPPLAPPPAPPTASPPAPTAEPLAESSSLMTGESDSGADVAFEDVPVPAAFATEFAFQSVRIPRAQPRQTLPGQRMPSRPVGGAAAKQTSCAPPPAAPAAPAFERVRIPRIPRSQARTVPTIPVPNAITVPGRRMPSRPLPSISPPPSPPPFSPLHDPSAEDDDVDKSSSRGGTSGWCSSASPLRLASPLPPPRPVSATSQPSRLFLRPERPRLTPKLPSASRRARFASGATGNFGSLDDEIDDISSVEVDDGVRATRCSRRSSSSSSDDVLNCLPTLPSASPSTTLRPLSMGRVASGGRRPPSAGRWATRGGGGGAAQRGHSTSDGAMLGGSETFSSSRRRRASGDSHESASRHPMPGCREWGGPSSSLAVARTPGGTLISRLAESPAVQKLSSAVQEVRRRLGGERSKRYRALPSENWKKARRLKSQVVLVRRWYEMVNRCDKRLWLEFKRSHTLLAGVVFKGSSGYTRAQTTQILLNSLALELVVLCMMYSAPTSDGPMVINPITILVSGLLAAAITIPGMLIFSMCFDPVASGGRVLRCVLRFPWRLGLLLGRCCCRSRPQSAYGGVSRHSMALPLRQGRRHRAEADHSRTASNGVELSDEPTAAMALAEGSHTRSGSSSGGEASPSRRMDSLASIQAAVLAAEAKAGGVDMSVGSQPQLVSSPESLEGVQRPPPLLLLPDGMDPMTAEEITSAIEEEEECSARPDSAPAPLPLERYYSYASLNEHMLALSLRRCLKRRDWPAVRQILGGWLLNWTLLLGLVVIFSIYGCKFYSIYSDQANGEMLLLSWAFSVGMRFLINEPLLILASKGVPMLFASAFCANVCGEAIVTCLGLSVDCIVGFVRAVTAA